MTIPFTHEPKFDVRDNNGLVSSALNFGNATNAARRIASEAAMFHDGPATVKQGRTGAIYEYCVIEQGNQAPFYTIAVHPAK